MSRLFRYGFHPVTLSRLFHADSIPQPCPVYFMRISSRNPVPFISCGFHPVTLSRLFHADFIREYQ